MKIWEPQRNSPEEVRLKSLVDREDLREDLGEDLREDLRNDYFLNVLN